MSLLEELLGMSGGFNSAGGFASAGGVFSFPRAMTLEERGRQMARLADQQAQMRSIPMQQPPRQEVQPRQQSQTPKRKHVESVVIDDFPQSTHLLYGGNIEE